MSLLKVISCQKQIARLLVVISYENIKELASLRFLKSDVNGIMKKTYEHIISVFHATIF